MSTFNAIDAVADMLFAAAAENHGKKAADAQQFQMVPITELTPEQIKKYAPEIDLNAAGSAFAKVRVPVPPTPAPTRAPAPAAARKPTKHPAPMPVPEMLPQSEDARAPGYVNPELEVS